MPEAPLQRRPRKTFDWSTAFIAVAVFVAAGVVYWRIVPGGPITVFPIAAAFLAVGAGIGATVAFVTSWTLLGYGRALVWELPFFGAEFVIWRSLVALPLPVVAGLLAHWLAGLFGMRTGSGA